MCKVILINSSVTPFLFLFISWVGFKKCSWNSVENCIVCQVHITNSKFWKMWQLYNTIISQCCQMTGKHSQWFCEQQNVVLKVFFSFLFLFFVRELDLCVNFFPLYLPVLQYFYCGAKVIKINQCIFQIKVLYKITFMVKKIYYEYLWEKEKFRLNFLGTYNMTLNSFWFITW